MMKITGNRIFSFMLAAAFALTLAGCGGGGGGTPAAAKCPDGKVGTPPNCMDPTPPTVDEQRALLPVADQVKIANAEEKAKDASDAAEDLLTRRSGVPSGAEWRVELIEADAGAARSAANKAMAARTDYATADAEAKKAEAIETRAKAALARIRTAVDNAKAAYDAATKAVTVAAAEEAYGNAKMYLQEVEDDLYNRNGDGIGWDSGAVLADNARKAAQAAAAEHTLRVLRMANRYPDKDADTRKTEVGKVAARIAAAANSTGRNDSRSSGSVSVTATWNANTPAAPDADPPTKEVPMYATVAITGLPGSDVSSVIDKQQVDANNDGDYDDDNDTKANARVIDGLPGFPHGFDVNAGNDERVIVFTDIEQEKGATAAVTLKEAVTLNNQNAVASRVVLPDNATNLNNPSYDHDGDPDTNALPSATLTCGSSQATDCSYTIKDGKLTSLVGYKVSVTAAANFELKAAQAAVPDTSYLTLGFWIDADNSGDEGLTPDFGAFAGGGSAVTGDIENVVKGTGTATYKGVATGVYTQGSSVDYFQGDAELDVDFGDADANGTIKGTIDNITAGGVSKSDIIKLSGPLANTAITETATITDQAAFSGVAHMGAGTTKDNITTYTYDGSWSGSFYNAGKEPDPDPNVDEIDVAPLSVAGTFGVTGTDNMGTKDDTSDDVTTSYVGAFGAHKQD